MDILLNTSKAHRICKYVHTCANEFILASAHFGSVDWNSEIYKIKLQNVLSICSVTVQFWKCERNMIIIFRNIERKFNEKNKKKKTLNILRHLWFMKDFRMFGLSSEWFSEQLAFAVIFNRLKTTKFFRIMNTKIPILKFRVQHEKRSVMQ